MFARTALPGLLLGVLISASAAEPAVPAEVGLWQTISDKTGKPEGYVRVTLVGDELRGVIERGMPGDDPNELCTKCPGERKNQRKQDKPDIATDETDEMREMREHAAEQAALFHVGSDEPNLPEMPKVRE